MKKYILFLMSTIFMSSDSCAQYFVINSNAGFVVYQDPNDTKKTTTTISSTGGFENFNSNTDPRKPIVDITNSALFLSGLDSKLSSVRSLQLNELIIGDSKNPNPKAVYTLTGSWVVTNDLTLKSGILSIPASQLNKLLYSGATNLLGSSDSYIQGTLFVQGNAGLRTFPIGDAKGYAPVVLQQVADADKNTELGFGVVSAGPTFSLGSGVLDYFKDRFWQFTNGNTGSYSGSQVWLSSNDTETFFSDGKSATVLENDATGTTNDLGASTTSGFLASNKLASSSARFYAIGKTDEITLKVHKLITPDGDTKNDVLFVEGIDSVPENEVTILDRWGVQFYKKKNFVNYPDASLPQQEGVDYSKLAIGNYVVVVQYNERGTTKSVKQMITVLK